jgi:hypothetical protein
MAHDQHRAAIDRATVALLHALLAMGVHSPTVIRAQGKRVALPPPWTFATWILVDIAVHVSGAQALALRRRESLLGDLALDLTRAGLRVRVRAELRARDKVEINVNTSVEG